MLAPMWSVVPATRTTPDSPEAASRIAGKRLGVRQLHCHDALGVVAHALPGEVAAIERQHDARQHGHEGDAELGRRQRPREGVPGRQPRRALEDARRLEAGHVERRVDPRGDAHDHEQRPEEGPQAGVARQRHVDDEQGVEERHEGRLRQHDAQRQRDRAENEVLGHELRHDLPAPRADGLPHADLLDAPRGRPERHIDVVDAREKQHEHGEADEQRRQNRVRRLGGPLPHVDGARRGRGEALEHDPLDARLGVRFVEARDVAAHLRLDGREVAGPAQQKERSDVGRGPVARAEALLGQREKDVEAQARVVGEGCGDGGNGHHPRRSVAEVDDEAAAERVGVAEELARRLGAEDGRAGIAEGVFRAGLQRKREHVEEAGVGEADALLERGARRPHVGLGGHRADGLLDLRKVGGQRRAEASRRRAPRRRRVAAALDAFGHHDAVRVGVSGVEGVVDLEEEVDRDAGRDGDGEADDVDRRRDAVAEQAAEGAAEVGREHGSYSERRARTGSAVAARSAWKQTVRSATASVTAPAPTNSPTVGSAR